MGKKDLQKWWGIRVYYSYTVFLGGCLLKSIPILKNLGKQRTRAMVAWETYLVQQRERFLSELMEFLRIPSISALSSHTADVRRAAKWL